MAESDLKFGIGAEDTGFAAKLEELKELSIETAEQIKAAFEMVNETFEKLQTAFVALTAILAGGEAFKEMIASTVEATVSSVALGRQLGISATEASVLKIAMASVHVTQEQFEGANAKLTNTMKKNEQAVKDLGVETRNSDGSYRNSLEVQLDVNAALMKLKEGFDRNTEASRIYGKSWESVAATLKITKAVMEEAKEEGEALGLLVGEEGIAQTEAYRKAMVAVHEVVEALSKVVGEAVLPAFTALGRWLKDEGPDAVSIFRKVVDTLSVVFQSVGDVVASVFSAIGTIFKTIGGVVLGFFGQDSAPVSAIVFFENLLRMVEAAFIGMRITTEIAIEAVLSVVDQLVGELRRLAMVSEATMSALGGQGKWEDINKAWKVGSSEIEATAQKHMDKIVDIAEKGGVDLKKAFTDPIGQAAQTTPTAAPDGGDHSKGTADKQAKLLQELAAELEARKAHWAEVQTANGTFIQFSLEQERAFWEEKKGLATAGSANATQINKDISKLTTEIDKEKYKDSLASLKAEQSAYKNNLDAKLAIAVEMAKKIAVAEGGNSAAAKQAGAEVLALAREIAAQKLAIEQTYLKASQDLALSEVDTAERAAELQNQLGRTTDSQLLAQERAFENERYLIKVTALQKTLALELQDPDKNPAKIATLNAQILALETQHDAQMNKLQAKSVLEANKDYKQLFSSMQSGFATTIQGFLKGTTTLAGAVKGLFQDVADSIIQMLANMAAQYLANTLMNIVSSKTSGASIIATLASQAGAGAFAATAAIPYVGPELAPAAGALAFSETMAYQASASAMGGYDIPANVNPLTQLHQKEMVLPTPYADVIRDLANKPGGGGNVALTVNAIDPRSFTKYVNQNGSNISKAIRKLNSRFM